MSSIAPSSILIGRASGDDLDDVMAVMNAAFDPRFGEAWTRAQCAGILPMNGVSMMLARHEGEAAGFSLARRIFDEAELLLIAVRPSHARKGIGQRLLQRFIDDQKSAGARNLHLEVRDGNPAVELYRANGFEIVGRRRLYYCGTDSERYDALTMGMAV